jgi:hypothetical protein
VLVKLKFPEEKFYLVVSPIHPPLGGIKVLLVDGFSDPKTMEILACREGFALASDVGLQNGSVKL